MKSGIYNILTLLFISLIGFWQSANAQQLNPSDSLKYKQAQKADSIAQHRKYVSSKHYLDSVRRARQYKLDSIKNSRARYLDSIKTIRQHTLDSTVNARKAIAEQLKQKLKKRSDSLNAIRKYKESRRYRDSVTQARNTHLNAVRAARQKIIDSVKAQRKHVLDSAINARKHITDSVRAIQKKRSDSLAVIRKYKESRRYRDSVKVVRQSRLDSIQHYRKMYNDNILTQRKQKLDSLTKMRKARLEQLTNQRKEKADSLKKLRELRTDSLAKKKEQREKQQKAEKKKREEKYKLQLDLKRKKKQDAWSNEKMLKKKWGFVRKNSQNIFTRYNYYFNARNKMLEAQNNMKNRKKDNYEELIDLFPFDPIKDSTVFASDMDTIIRKVSVGIQIHDPRTKWADDLYLLMGKAYYYKGDFEKAETCFKYIIGLQKTIKQQKKKNQAKKDEGLVHAEKKGIFNFLKHKPAHNDAILWLTRTYADNNRTSDAEAILDLLDANEKVSENMKAKIALEKANLKIKQGDYSDANTELNQVATSKAVDLYTRQRASFLSAQLYKNTSLEDSAYKYFNKNIQLHPKIAMDFYAHKYKAEASIASGQDKTGNLKMLNKMTKDGKYATYHEQLYYLLAKLSAQNNETDNAINFYTKSLRTGKSTPKQKALTFASLGNLQYNLKRYPEAKRSFDSASYFAKKLEGYSELDLALKRGKSLDKLVEPYNQLHNADSLLTLSLMNEKEQKNAIKKYLRYLEKQKEDSALNVQMAASANSLANANNNNPGTSNWYFGSSVAVQQGYNEFKKKWGNRPLSDNWRRGSSNILGSISQSSEDSLQTAIDNTNMDIEEKLFAAIPKTEEQRKQLKTLIQESYLNVSSAYIKDLDEYLEGLNYLDSLNKHYPDHPYKDAELSIKYTAALRQGQLETANKLRQELISNYPNSKYSLAISENEIKTEDSSASQVSVSDYYISSYQLLDDRAYEEVIARCQKALKTYNEPNYTRKFKVLEAQAIVALGNYKKADTLAKAYLKEYPSDSLKPWIDAVRVRVEALEKADTLNKLDTNKLSNIKIKTDSLNLKHSDSVVLNKVENSPDHFSYNTNEIHYCIFVLGKPDSKTEGFRAALSDFAMIKFNGLGVNVFSDILNPDQAMVVVKTFSNVSQAKVFINKAKTEKLLYRELPENSAQALLISASNFLKLKTDKRLTPYQQFYQRNYK